MNDFKPKIVAFVCNWCSYAGADNAGGQKFDYPANVKLIRVMCSGRIDPQFVMKAFRQGADGVLVSGCRPGDCHYRDGNMKALRRFRMFEMVLDQFGIEKGRFELKWIAAGEGKRFQQITSELTERIKKLGPLELNGSVTKEVA
jgi:F420-non-reducing hydrogenase iron-sulfur subunit